MIEGSGYGLSDKRTKFSDAQIASVLKQAEDGTSVGEVCRKAGISERPNTTGARYTSG
jgi:putative transposase